MSSPAKGYITVATGDSAYADMAVDMALSISEFDRLPVSIVADDVAGDHIKRFYSGIFDQVLKYPSNVPFGYISKYYVGELTPYRETMFIDADSILLGHMKRFWAAMYDKPFALIGDYCDRYCMKKHHGVSVSHLIELFNLEQYLYCHTGVFYFKKDFGIRILHECIRVHAALSKHFPQWSTGFVPDELTFGIIGGLKKVSVFPEPGPIYWPEEMKHMGTHTMPAKPVLHFIGYMPDSILKSQLKEIRRRRVEKGLHSGSELLWKQKRSYYGGSALVRNYYRVRRILRALSGRLRIVTHRFVK